MIDTPAHLQHMNVVNDFVYILSGCGKHSMLVWGFNQCTMVSSWYHFSFRCDLDFQPFLKIYSKECGGNSMMMDTPAHLQHMNVVNDFV
jgi:hypothetical protein